MNSGPASPGKANSDQATRDKGMESRRRHLGKGGGGGRGEGGRREGSGEKKKRVVKWK